MSKLAIICPQDKAMLAAAEIIAAGARACGAEADIFDLSLDPACLPCTMPPLSGWATATIVR